LPINNQSKSYISEASLMSGSTSQKATIILSVQNKLLIGFGVILILIALMAINNLFQVKNVSNVEQRLIGLRMPTVMAGMQLTDGIHLSLAGLRGYMILGNDPQKAELFKKERLQGWKEIDHALKQMIGFSQNWTDPENIQILNKMKPLIKQFRQYQQEVENISHQLNNFPALMMLQINATPKANQIVLAITSMIDEEARLDSTPERKQLLKLMADSRGSFALALASIRTYLITGRKQFANDFRKKLKINTERLKQISSMSHLFTDTQNIYWNTYKQEREVFMSFPDKMIQLRQAKDWNKANHLLGTKAAPTAKKIMVLLKQMQASQEKLVQADENEFENDISSMTKIMIIGTLIVIILGVITAVFISRQIVIPLNRVVQQAKEISSGNLTHTELPISSQDELGELTVAINNMNQDLLDIVAKINSSSKEVSSSSSELYDITLRSSDIINQQQVQSEQASSSMSQMSSSVFNISQNIENTFLAAQEANTETTEGRLMVDDAVQAIQHLAQQIEGGTGVVKQLEEDSDSIGSVLEVIKGIAEQTNLLALNAAIEAARAGESGRGFAVVADEVRTLAGRTQESAQEINIVIEKLQSGSRQAVETMNQSHQQAQQVVEQANKAGLSLSAISAVVERINSMSSEISTMAEQQNATTEEVKINIDTIAKMAQENASGAQDTAASSKSLSELSTQLEGTIQHFKI